jgi:DNA polymerase III delta subunit
MARKRRTAKAPGLRAMDLAATLASGPPKPCYLLLGDETFLVRQALSALRTQILGDNPGPAYQEFDGAKAELAPILDELRTMPFLGTQHRLVVVDRIATNGGFASKYSDALVAFLQSPPDTATLVMTATKLDGRLKATKALKAALTVVDCGSLDDAGMLGFLRSRAKEYGRPFARRADHVLIEQLGGQSVSLALIDAEVKKLSCAGTGEITQEEIEALCSFGSAEQAFGLIDRMGSGDVEGALTLLERIFRDGLITAGGSRTRDHSGIAMILLPTLRWDLGRLLRAEAMLSRGQNERAITKAVRVYRDQRRFMTRVRRADKSELRRRHTVLRQADVALRSSTGPLSTMIRVVSTLALSERGVARA